ncbi:MAG: glycosyltransferase family 2 protein [Deltaproteobacteria bacterium]|nr:glycosyltransferase family 2 protein [Deltaproteobacteria bacterium]
MSIENPLISIVIVNYDGKELLRECLGTVFAEKKVSFEVIVVDNGSSDGSVEFLHEKYPDVKVVENKHNTGFAPANNQAILMARGKYILTLNNDTELAEGFIKEISTAAELSEDDVGMWAPKILSIFDKETIDSVGGLLLYPDGIGRGRGRMEKDTGQFNEVEEVLLPSACAALYRKTMLDHIGLFDEDFFAYCEDTDLGLRARSYGWRCFSVPSAVVYHHYSATGGRYSSLKAYLVERNRAWVAVKNLPLTLLLKSPFYTLYRYLLQLLSVFGGRGSAGGLMKEAGGVSLALVLLRSYASIIRGFFGALGKRRKIMKERKISSRDFAGLLSRFTLSAKELVFKD